MRISQCLWCGICPLFDATMCILHCLSYSPLKEFGYLRIFNTLNMMSFSNIPCEMLYKKFRGGFGWRFYIEMINYAMQAEMKMVVSCIRCHKWWIKEDRELKTESNVLMFCESLCTWLGPCHLSTMMISITSLACFRFSSFCNLRHKSSK